MNFLPWLGVVICLFHSAMFSGLNLGFFGLSRLKLVVHAESGNEDAIRILGLRKDAHLLLTTLLWGNVASNVLLALFSESVLAGVGAFFFSTVVITFLGEIFPQAYLARHALKVSHVLVPIIQFYKILLYPVAKPSALLLDHLLGKEEIDYFQEDEIKILLQRHGRSRLTDLEKLEAVGAVNFLAMDDVSIENEGEIINPKSIIKLPTTEKGLPIFPEFNKEGDDPFLQNVHASQEKWVILTNEAGRPLLVLNSDQFLRDVMYEDEVKSVYTYCHRPIVVTEPDTRLGDVILQFKVRAQHYEDDVVDNDIVLFWGDQKRIITGADILGRLLRGIVKRVLSH
jgi:hypothetical protein